MGKVDDLLAANKRRYGTSDRDLAILVGSNKDAVGKWRRITYTHIPPAVELYRLSLQIHKTFREVLEAFLYDSGYREDVMGNVEHPAPTKKLTKKQVAEDEEARRVAGQVLEEDDGPTP